MGWIEWRSCCGCFKLMYCRVAYLSQEPEFAWDLLLLHCGPGVWRTGQSSYTSSRTLWRLFAQDYKGLAIEEEFPKVAINRAESEMKRINHVTNFACVIFWISLVKMSAGASEYPQQDVDVNEAGIIQKLYLPPDHASDSSPIFLTFSFTPWI